MIQYALLVEELLTGAVRIRFPELANYMVGHRGHCERMQTLADSPQTLRVVHDVASKYKLPPNWTRCPAVVRGVAALALQARAKSLSLLYYGDAAVATAIKRACTCGLRRATTAQSSRALHARCAMTRQGGQLGHAASSNGEGY